MNLPPEVLDKLRPAMDAIRAEVSRTVPMALDIQRIDRTGLVFARLNDGGAHGAYNRGFTQIVTKALGEETVNAMRRARRKANREGRPIVEELPEEGGRSRRIPDNSLNRDDSNDDD